MEWAELIAKSGPAWFWPVLAGSALYYYRDAIGDAIRSQGIQLSIFGVLLKIAPSELKESLELNLLDKEFTKEQQELLRRLRKSDLIDKRPSDVKALRPLRDAGLVRQVPPDKFLQDAPQVRITPLGRRLIDEYERKQN
jgi:hypothetical protein